MPEDKPLVVKPAGFSNAVIAVLLFFSVSCNIYLAFRSADIMKELASRKMAQTVIEKNFYGLFQFIDSNTRIIKERSESGGFFERLFGRNGQDFPDIDKWKDPYDERPYDER